MVNVRMMLLRGLQCRSEMKFHSMTPCKYRQNKYVRAGNERSGASLTRARIKSILKFQPLYSLRGVSWNARKSMWKIYFSRDGICKFFWNAQNSNTFRFSLFFVRILITCSFFEMPDFHMFDYFEMPNFRIRMNRKSGISK